MKLPSNRGNALGGTLLVMVLLFIFGLTLANMATFDLRLVNKTGERQAAREAAEAGLADVTNRICQDPTIGSSDEIFERTLPDGSSYRVTFDRDDEYWCLNNLSSLSMNPGPLSRNVPPNHALFFAEGRSKGGEVAIIESLIRLEALPYAIAATNQISAPVGVTVNGAFSRAAPTDLKGSTYSGSDAGNSTVLGALSSVTGDVHSVGGASVNSGAVQGDVETDHDVVALPNFNIESFSTVDDPHARAIPGGGIGLIDSFSGPVYIDGPKTFAVVTMNNAVVYVNGDLNIVALIGSGAIFVNGKTTFTAPITLNQPSSRITLFSKGDITVAALGIFQGVLITQGNFRANLALTVSGAIYANGLASAGGGGGSVNLSGLINVVTHVDEYTAFASYWLAMGGDAQPLQVYWNQIR